MRTLTLTCTIAAISGWALGPASGADVYVPSPAYRAPRAAYVPPPRYVVPVAPVIVEQPLGVITVPEGWAYVVPHPAYQRGTEYAQSPVLLDGHHYRRCWHEWGQLRCAVSRHW